MTCRHTVSLGAYLLGALDPADRPAFERHLETCPICTAEMFRLAPIPGLLQRVTPEDFEAVQLLDAEPLPVEVVEPVPEPEPRVSWWRRSGVTLAAAAAVVLLAIGGIFVLRPVGGSDASQVTWSAVDPTTGVHGKVDLTTRAWGTEVKVSMQDVPAGRKICHLVVYGRDGSQEVAGKWTAGYYREVNSIPGSSSIKLKDIDRVEVVAGGGVLVGMHSP
ncbi:zf-HC2 domain-containing protein [Kibdelosporangium philippinense]|uniref:Zf-HC2 domain-containing protein n=1 Tax=Kibdelosporangium philippinense TaxID=211113 RepID=A0ABS8ZJ29_9PSEU|nr:zf-HC2 domain-containing protein [Kibdelosporangium philippinense]MCE7007776.1 zf-HC2 domain-containing protein [Kibdelosporangium philippinense]